VNNMLDVHAVNTVLFIRRGREARMASGSKAADAEKARIMLGLLESVERGDAQSQRRLASDLGVALGLVNAYLKRCINKGLVKVSEAPARRYAYYLTPHGFAEKSRLTVEYLSYSFSLFRRAKTDYAAALNTARDRGFKRIALLGVSDLAEIAAICALDTGIVIAAVVDPQSELLRFAGVPVVKSIDDILDSVDAVLVTDVKTTWETTKAAVQRYGTERVLVPELLGVRATHGDAA
jgi:DNA-binding MarR family transcriptional regulator